MVIHDRKGDLLEMLGTPCSQCRSEIKEYPFVILSIRDRHLEAHESVFHHDCVGFLSRVIESDMVEMDDHRNKRWQANQLKLAGV